MQKGDKALTPQIAFTDTKANIEAYPNPEEGMWAQQTDSPYAVGRYANGAWTWVSGGSVDSVVAGTNIDVDATDPANPIVATEQDVDLGSIQFDVAHVALPDSEGLMQWNVDDGTLDLNLPNGVTGQLFLEDYFSYKNQTGSTLTDGMPLMFAGTLGASGILLAQPAIADGSLKNEYFIGVATHDTLDGDNGKVTWRGKVRGIDTTGTPYSEVWADGDLLWVSQATAGFLTNVEPTHGQKILAACVVYADDNVGELLLRPTWNDEDLYMIHEDTFDPSGWLPAKRWSKATVAISTTKLKITLTSTTNLQYYWRGHKVDLGAVSLDVTSLDDKAEGIWYCYSTDGVNFILSQTPFYIFDYVLGAMRADLMAWEFYWDNVNDVAIWLQPEFHSAALARQVHGYLHESMGTRYSNGLEISYGTTYANADTRIKLTSGEIHDEDISCYITHDATPTEIWEQILGSAGTADANYGALPIFYLSGATPVWRKVAASSYPFLPVSNNYIYYNRLNAGSWDYTTSIGLTDFVVYWVVATTNQTEPVCIIPGRADHATLTAAEAEAFPSASVSTLFTEYKILYRIIYQTGGAGNANNGKCKINKVTDYRKDSLANNAVVGGTTSAALVAFTPAGTIAATNVQAAIEELDGDIQALGSPLTDGSLTGDGSVATPLSTASGETHATAAGITTLTVASPRIQIFTGSAVEECRLPVLATLRSGQEFVITNNSSGGNVTVTSSTGSSLIVVPRYQTIICRENGGGGWDIVEFVVNGNSHTHDGTAGQGGGTISHESLSLKGTQTHALIDQNMSGATTATAAGTTTLTVTSPRVQEFTGSTTQTVVLPVTSTLRLGFEFLFINKSTGIVTINSSGSNLVHTLLPGQFVQIVCALITGTAAASWSVLTYSGEKLLSETVYSTAPNCDLYSMHILTAQNAGFTVGAMTGNPSNGQKYIFRFKDDGGARVIGWNAIYRAMGIALPLTTVISKTLYLGFIYNSTDTKWDLIASAQEA